MQYSIVNKSNLVSDMRFDAEAYLPIYFDIERKLEFYDYTTIEKESTLFAKGIFDIKAENYVESGGIPFVRIGNLKEMLISENDIIFIPEEENTKNKKTYLKRGDVILSKTAYPSSSFVNLDHCNTSQDTIAVKLKKNSKITSQFLTVFLNSKYGFLQMLRWFTGNIQMHLNLTDSKGIKIPVFSTGFQGKISIIFEEAIKKVGNSKSLYSQAEQLLLSELDLTHWKPKHELAFVKNFSDTEQAKRFDAEYFHPKYEEIIETVKKYKSGFDELGNLVKIKDKNFTPKDNEQYKYIELANISSNGEINGCLENFGKELPSRARRKVQKGDLIISSIEGSLESIALITEDGENVLCSTGFFVINSDKINSESLLVLLKTKVGQLQLKKGCKGTILTAIGKKELSKIVLPKIEQEKQQLIKEKIAEMYKVKKLSQSLLEIAKRGVEIAIEEKQDTATKWINSEVAKLGIKLE